MVVGHVKEKSCPQKYDMRNITIQVVFIIQIQCNNTVSAFEWFFKDHH